MKKILTIGNSFGSDAMRYIYGIARADKKQVKAVNLYIGGCSLYRHYRNMQSGGRVYEYEINGMRTGMLVSLKETLLADEWDVVVLQQCSPHSGEYERYLPYLPRLAEYVREMAPAAKIYIQMTWSFAEGCTRFALSPFETREQMIPMIRDAYTKGAELIKADGVIPSLDAMCKLYDVIGENTYRDGYHCNLGITRYMLGCIWYMVFFRKSVEENTYRDFDVEVTEEEVALAKRIAIETVTEKGFIIK